MEQNSHIGNQQSSSSRLLKKPTRSPLDHPSVAVLPFTEVDNESLQNRTGSWLSEEVIHHLSRFRHLSVLGSRSHLTALRNHGTLEGIARSLGARYLVTGFVRKTADCLEVMVYLVAGETGKKLWSSTYRKQRSAILELQDDLAAEMASSIATSIDALERERLESQDGQARLAGSTPLILLADQLTKQFQRHANERARKLIEIALSIDPLSARAHAVLSRTHHLDSRYAWTSDPDDSNERAVELADIAIQLDPMEAAGHAEMGMNQHFQRDYDAAFAAYRRSLDINPNDPDILADFGDLLISNGSPEEAIEALTMAIRLRPERAGMYRYYLAGAFDILGDHETVINLLLMKGGNQEGHRMLASSHARLGLFDKAAFHAAMAMKAHPNFSLSHWRSVLPHRDQDARESLIEGMERAGLD